MLPNYCQHEKTTNVLKEWIEISRAFQIATEIKYSHFYNCRYPANTGNFYHMPMWSSFSKVNSAVWETQVGQNTFVHVVLDTDYANWAVFLQCSEQGSGEPTFHSTRILSRMRHPVGADHWIKIEKAVETAQAAMPFRYAIEQGNCQDVE